MNVAPDPTDVCAWGHQLAPGSDEIVIKTYDDDGRKTSEEVKLLRRHWSMGPGGLYAGGQRMIEQDQSGRIVREWVEGADPADHGYSATRPDKVVAYPCDHAIPESEIDPLDLPAGPFRGSSYGRAHWLTYSAKVVGKVVIPLAQCPVCLGQPAPDWRA